MKIEKFHLRYEVDDIVFSKKRKLNYSYLQVFNVNIYIY